MAYTVNVAGGRYSYVSTYNMIILFKPERDPYARQQYDHWQDLLLQFLAGRKVVFPNSVVDQKALGGRANTSLLAD